MKRSKIHVVAAVIEQEGRYLITQRQKTAVLPLLWEFPGGKIEPEESEEDALRREVFGRLGKDIKILEKIGTNNHEYPRYDIEIHLFACELTGPGHPRTVSVNDLRWVKSCELADYDFAPADEESMDKLLGLLVN